MKHLFPLSLVLFAFGQIVVAQDVPVQETFNVPYQGRTLVIKAAIDVRLPFGSAVCFDIVGSASAALPQGDSAELREALNQSRVAKGALFVALSPNQPPDFGDGTEEITEASVLGGHMDTVTEPKPFYVIGVKFSRANSRGFDSSQMFTCEATSFAEGKSPF